MSFGHLSSFARVACGDALHCVISVEPSSLNSALLIHTSDGGMTGSLVSPFEEANLLGSPLSVLSVAFTNPSTAVAVGREGASFLSGDAGATFRAPSYNLLQRVANDRRIRLGQSPLDAYMPLEEPTEEIAATTDGGLSWNPLRIPSTHWCASGRELRPFFCLDPDF